MEIYRVDESGMFPIGRVVGDFHWHEELQFTIALQSTLTIQADARRYTSKLLSFFPGSHMEQDDVLPWVTGGVPASLQLTCETGNGSAALTCLSEIFVSGRNHFPTALMESPSDSQNCGTIRFPAWNTPRLQFLPFPLSNASVFRICFLSSMPITPKI